MHNRGHDPRSSYTRMRLAHFEMRVGMLHALASSLYLCRPSVAGWRSHQGHFAVCDVCGVYDNRCHVRMMLLRLLARPSTNTHHLATSIQRAHHRPSSCQHGHPRRHDVPRYKDEAARVRLRTPFCKQRHKCEHSYVLRPLVALIL